MPVPPARLQRALAAPALPWALLALALGLHVLGMAAWIGAEQAIGRPVYSGSAGHLADALHLVAARGLPAYLASPEAAWYTLPPVLLARLGGTDPAVLLWSQVLLMLCAQALIFDLGRLLGGPWSGLIAAAVLPLLPEVALYEHRWAPHLAQLTLLLAAADALVRSRSLSRPLPSLAFAVLGALSLGASGMATDNYCTLAALGAMAAGALARGLILGRGPRPDEPIRRLGPALFGTLAAGAVAWVLIRAGHLGFDLAYVQRETAPGAYADLAPRGSLAALTAYARFWYRTSLSPLFALALLAALVAYARRGAGRAEILGWLLLPLAAFSLLAKKNPYYIGPSLPAAALVLGLGLPRLRRPGVAIAIAVVAAGGVQWAARSLPGFRCPLPFVPYRLIPDAERVFQAPIVPSIAPERAFANARVLDLLRPHVRDSACALPIARRLWVLAPGDHQDVRLALALQDPCVGNIGSWPETGEIGLARWVVVADPTCGAPAGQAPAPWADFARRLTLGGSLRPVAEDRAEPPCLALYRFSGLGGPRR